MIVNLCHLGLHIILSFTLALNNMNVYWFMVIRVKLKNVSKNNKDCRHKILFSAKINKSLKGTVYNGTFLGADGTDGEAVFASVGGDADSISLFVEIEEGGCSGTVQLDAVCPIGTSLGTPTVS